MNIYAEEHAELVSPITREQLEHWAKDPAPREKAMIEEFNAFARGECARPRWLGETQDISLALIELTT